MRVWDFPVLLLCSCHRSGEHREIHGIFGVLAKGESSPYYKHPEVQRWIGNEYLLWLRHQEVAATLKRHKSPIVKPIEYTTSLQIVDSLEDQLINIANKCKDPEHRCSCDIGKLVSYVETSNVLQ